MQENRRKQARAIAIAKAEDARLGTLVLLSITVTMAAAFIFGLMIFGS